MCDSETITFVPNKENLFQKIRTDEGQGFTRRRINLTVTLTEVIYNTLINLPDNYFLQYWP